MREDLPTVLRAGSGDVLDETRALFRIGVVRDVYLIGGTLPAAAALGSEASDQRPSPTTTRSTSRAIDGAVEPFATYVRALRAVAPAS